MPQAICVVLAGGQSRRMGRNKALLYLGNKTFLSHLIDLYSEAFPVYVSVAEAGRLSWSGAEEIPDLHPGKGPLAGLEAAFVRTGADHIFLTATDLPFGTVPLAKELLKRISDFDACVIRRNDGKVEPMFAVYGASCFPYIQAMLKEDKRAVHELLDRVRVRWVEETELFGYDLDHILCNVNTPEDYQKAIDYCRDTTDKLLQI